jgi:eukaryotic-like serine/threonine-protein kinase
MDALKRGFRVRRTLAVSMSTTVAEVELADGRRVVRKALRGGALLDERVRFAREYATLRAVSHRSIVRTLTTEQEFDGSFLMPLLVGTTLRAWLERIGPMGPEALRWVVTDIACALELLHSRGIVHRDVKPHNLFFGRELFEPVTEARGILLDLGIATSGAPLTSEGHVVGTPRYLAPEQLVGGRVDARTDVFALGLVIFEMTTGEPFRAARHTEEALTFDRRARELGREARRRLAPFERVVARATELRPDARFASAMDLALALGEIRRAA